MSSRLVAKWSRGAGSLVRTPCGRRSVRRAATVFGRVIEAMESRVLLSAGIEFDPIWLASLETPKLRQPGAGIEVDPGLIPGPDAPPLAGTFDGINFDSNASNAGYYMIPPDPIAAAGPGQVLSVVNTTIQWYNKSGTLQYNNRLGKNSSTAAGSFFAPLSPVSTTFDPKVVYDQYNGRFVVITLEQQDTANGAAANSSRILVAVSDDSDPNGTWYYGAINSRMTITGTDSWMDYPGLAVDANAIYITGNMFGFGASGTFKGSRVWIINKSPLYSGGAISSAVYDPSALASLPGNAFTLQPSHMFGAAPGATGTFLVNSGWLSGSTDYISVIRVSNPLSSPTFANTFVSVGDISNTSVSIPKSPQQGTSTLIDSGDGRVYNAVWRNNELWFADLVNPPSGVDAGTATAHWFRFSANSSSVSLLDQANIGGEEIATGARTFYPAVAVDANNNMAVGFAASGPTLYPGAYYTGRLSSAPAGTLQPSVALAVGQDYYIRTFTSGSTGRNRWGDYSGMSLDPSDGATFWVYNEYAMPRGTAFGGEDGRWGTRFGSFSFDQTAPTVTGVSSTTPNAWYTTAAAISITVSFSENVTVTGVPTLALNSGGIASYASGSGTANLIFNYTVGAGQNAADLDYSSINALALGGGTIKDAAGNNAVLTLSAPGAAGSLGANKNIGIDTIAPTDIALSNAGVAENQPSGTTVGGLSTTHSDVGDTFTYTLVGGAGSADNGSFTISGSTLQTAAIFDFETKSSYSIRIRTTDRAGSWYEKPFTITVTDVLDLAWLDPASVATWNAGAHILTVTGWAKIIADPGADNPTIVDSNTGALEIAAGITVTNIIAITGEGSLTVDAGASLSVRSIAQTSMTVHGALTIPNGTAGGTSIILGSIDGGGNTVVPGTLNLTGSGRIDLTDRTLVIHYLGASPVFAIQTALAAGRNVPTGGVFDGSWDGPAGIMSSRAAQDFIDNGLTEYFVVGYGDTANMLINDAPDMQNLASTVFVRYTRVGDATMDGIVVDNEVTVVGLQFDRTGGLGPMHWYDGDYNYNGIVDDNDVTALGLMYDLSAAPVPFAAQAAVSPGAPEPTFAAVNANLMVNPTANQVGAQIFSVDPIASNLDWSDNTASHDIVLDVMDAGQLGLL